MKTFIKLLFCFSIINNSYSQDKGKALYLLINEKDTLIKKTKYKKGNICYQIFSTENVKTRKNNTPVVEGKIWGENDDYDYYVYAREVSHFDTYKSKLITKEELNTLDYTDNRDDFLKKFKEDYYSSSIYSSISFIEPTNDGKFILRLVYPLEFE